MSAPKPQNEVEVKRRLRSPTIYEIISHEGKEELARPFQSLAWSAVVAGICISFCLFAEGFLQLHLEGEGGHYFLIENLGYTVGFVIVVLGRFQLFTEHTITVILPLLEKFSAYRFSRTMKLWGVILFFNFVGTFLVAVLITNFSFFSDAQMEVFFEISKHAVDREFDLVFLQAIPAGFLIATMVWMIPSAESSQLWVIVLMTYLIAIGDFAHIVAGSAEAFLVMLNGQVSLYQGLGFMFFACLGNIIGGTGLFALTAYAQVQQEMD